MHAISLSKQWNVTQDLEHLRTEQPDGEQTLHQSEDPAIKLYRFSGTIRVGDDQPVPDISVAGLVNPRVVSDPWVFLAVILRGFAPNIVYRRLRYR